MWPQPAAGESASGDPEILFTFDDGPNPRTTPLVLDELARHGIRAVFFLVGDRTRDHQPRAAAIIQRILREGHVIASHTMAHHDLCRITEDEAAADLDGGKAIVEAVAAVPTAWFRAPYGARCDQLERLLAARGLVHFHWDLDPQEWRSSRPARTVRYVTRALSQASGRNVLLLHDVKQATVKALPQILTWLDAENARRKKAHQPPIRILQAPVLAVEQLPRGFGAWVQIATEGARSLPAAIASALP